MEPVPLIEEEEERLPLAEQVQRLRRRLKEAEVRIEGLVYGVYTRMDKSVDQLGRVTELVERLAVQQNEIRNDVENKHQRVMDVLGRLVKEEE